MKTLKAKLEKKGVYFSTKLPSHHQIFKTLHFQGNTRYFSQKGGPFSKRDTTPLVICDRKLKQNQEVNAWLKNYPVYFVSAGEKLKTLDTFHTHINKIIKISAQKKISGFISLGGGSVGDFTGFIASIYKRGVPLVHIPSTWLSAMDSAHGGKTALNTEEIKNIVGSYCFPKAVFIVKELLFSLPEKEKESAKGELVKVALIIGGAFYKDVLKQILKKKVPTHLDLWRLLPQAVLSKLTIVEKDPYEKKGFRSLLNLGHTLGHVLESYFSIPHGQAVLYGIVFTTKWSHRRFTLPLFFLKEFSFFEETQKKLAFYLRKIPSHKLTELLLQDKKRINKDRVNFIFLKGPGLVFAEEVSLQKIIKEVKNQSFLYNQEWKISKRT